MDKKRVGFLEQHIDKIVFGVVGIICLTVLWFFVISASYKGEYQGRKLGPGEIDSVVKGRAEILQGKLNKPEEVRQYEGDKIADYVVVLSSSLWDISDNANFPLPGAGGKVINEDRLYQMPDIPVLTEVAVELIRTAVSVPKEEVDLTHTYKDIKVEIGDIDLVTVGASFNVDKLYSNFDQSFAGPRVRPRQWRNDEFAQPVFAAVGLERQKLQDNATWSDWQELPLSKVNYLRKSHRPPRQVLQMEYGGVDLLKVKYGLWDIQKNIVQPAGYDFLASNEKWYPPALHKEYAKLREQDRQEKLRTGRTGRAARARATAGREGATAGMEMMMGPGAFAPTRPKRERLVRPGQEELTEKDIEKLYKEMQLEGKRGFEDLREESLTIWAYDDDLKDEGKYRYRMRVGLFNPIVGKRWVSDDDLPLNDQVVLWSQYSDVTEIVEITPMLHLFPIDVASVEGQPDVTMQVSKFYYGKWRSHQFEVRPGEMIGDLVEAEDKEEVENTRMMGMVGMMGFGGEGIGSKLDKVDYSSDSILVDVVQMTDMAGVGALRSRKYSEVLCSSDGLTIAHLPVSKRNWPKSMRSKFEKIADAESEQVQIRGARGGGEMDMMMMGR